jgi:FtsP/CotA-like multicopper oxidase with cupredoxin domain
MRALVIGLHVAPRGAPRAASADPPRDIRLLVQTKPHGLVLGAAPAYGFVVQRDKAPARDSVALPGPPLELERGKPVRITVVNNLDEPTGVHWHGMEIESFPDGVPGWSGTPGRIMPPIAPRDSFVAEFTPPRAGTFLYHSHLHELRQIGSGMYGALLVVDAPRDTTRDHVVVVGGGGPPVYHKLDSPWALVNGRVQPRPLRLTAGETHRLRLVSIHPEWAVTYALVNDSVTARWRAVAKDGADLPPALATTRLARATMGPGETADFEVSFPGPGRWRLEAYSEFPTWRIPLDVIVEPRKP